MVLLNLVEIYRPDLRNPYQRLPSNMANLNSEVSRGQIDGPDTLLLRFRSK